MWYAIAAIVAALFSAAGSYSQGQSQKKIMEYNAQLAEMQASEKRKQAAFQAERLEEKNEALKSRQRLLFNLSGVTPEGTPTNLLLDTTRKMELDALAIRYGGESAGSALEAEAQLKRMQGSAASSAGWWNAGTSLLSGATRVASAYGGYSK